MWHGAEDVVEADDGVRQRRFSDRPRIFFAGATGDGRHYRILAGALSANVVKQYLSWTRMLRKLNSYAPEFVAEHGDAARAYQLRYLARRAVQLGNPHLARDLFSKAIGLQPAILVAEPRKTTTTAAAILAAKVLGKDRFSALMRPYLKAAA